MASFLLALGIVSPAQACTTAVLVHDDEVVVAKSYDYSMSQGLLFVNPRGLAKSSMVFGEATPARWESRYGSVTFNQYGRELPASGMNEAGLVVEVMWLDETRYEPSDSRPVLPDLQWIQYQLDRFATVEDVVAHAEELRVASRTARIHFLVSDRNGSCATIEFLNGDLVIHTGDAMPARTLTNHNYTAACEYLAKHRGFGGSAPIPSGRGSLQRFVRASSLAARAAQEDGGEPGLVDDAFALLDSVSQGPSSVWNLVYEPRSGRIHYRTHAHPSIKRIDLERVDFSCEAGSASIDLDAEISGEVSRSLLPYDPAANLRLVRRSFAESPVPIAESAVHVVARFPDRFRCLQSKP